MRAIIVSTTILLATLAFSPTAAAEPCEVPGCQVAGAVLCIAGDAKEILANPKQTVTVVADCTTVTTGPL
jgi:hypothetical protein